MSAHTATWHHPTGRHAAHGRVLLARWTRHALVALLHLARRYRPRHRLREAFGADVAFAQRPSTMGFPVFEGALRADRDRLSTLLRGMARRASHSRRLFRRRASRCNIFMHERNFARAELARLRERYQECWDLAAEAIPYAGEFFDEKWGLSETLAKLKPADEGRPSTGDTDGTRARAELRCTATTTHPPLYGRVQCQSRRGHGRLHSNSYFGVHWGDAALPEGHAEPEPAWGKDRPVHGHTEQTGDGHG